MLSLTLLQLLDGRSWGAIKTRWPKTYGLFVIAMIPSLPVVVTCIRTLEPLGRSSVCLKTCAQNVVSSAVRQISYILFQSVERVLLQGFQELGFQRTSLFLRISQHGLLAVMVQHQRFSGCPWTQILQQLIHRGIVPRQIAPKPNSQL